MTLARRLDPDDLIERARDAARSAMPSSWKATPGLSEKHRPVHWAQPALPDLEGVKNLWQVAPGLFRSGQPTAAGFRQLQDFGISSVINLRQTVSDVSLAAGTGLALVRIPIKSRHVAENRGERIVKAMRALRAGHEIGPVLVHCHHGSDRTGVLIALWRSLYEGWSRQAALDELISGGFGFHPIWANIPRYLRKVDLKDLHTRIERRAIR